MKKLVLAIAILCLASIDVEAQGARADLVVRSRALGGAFSSRADDPSTIFVNPAGMVSTESLAMYADYGEPVAVRPGRESRLALVAGAPKTRFGLGWYRFGGTDGAGDNLLAAGAARKLVEGTPGSFLAVGATVAVRKASIEPTCCGTRDGGRKSSWSKLTGDIGLIVRPLPVVSLAYAIGNIMDEHSGVEGDIDAWRRAQRWGVSYYWEERVVLSLEERFSAGRTTLHYGFSVKTALPVELMAGFSDGNATGGARWLGEWFKVAIAFSSNAGERVTWTGSCEMAYPEKKVEGTE
jgi:hypothetical protein